MSLITAATLVGCACFVAVAWASETFTVNTNFTPNKLGASTNLSAKAVFAYSNESVPTAVNNVVAYGPAGLGVEVSGAGTCEKAKLEQEGPSGCPADSRIGFGGGLGLVEIAKDIVKEPFTLDFFLSPKENGHLVILIYVEAENPVTVQLVLVAKEIHGPRPYGFGLSIKVPPITTIPGAAYAAVETTEISLGSQKVTYYEKVHNKRKLVHVKGLIVPEKCPAGGFPFEVTIGFLDGTSSTAKHMSPCPRK
ncbi:MAG: hypothetical protein WAN93_02800 [Solirubrobacteraceae bacterium]